MEIGSIQIIVEIDKNPCLVVLEDMDEQRKNLLIMVLQGFCKDEKLNVLKLGDNFTYSKLKKEDLKFDK